MDQSSEPTATESPVQANGPADERTFNKPNLVLKDPDKYAFAHRIRRLTFVLAGLILLVAGPYICGLFAYQIRYKQLRADVDVATDGLAEIKPRLQDFMTASRLVAKKVGPSVVSVQRPNFQGPDGQGSGVIVDVEGNSGFILTNFHVVDGASALNVHLDDGRYVNATVIGADQATDLAVLKINTTNLIAASWSDSDELEVGDLVWAVGSPFGLDRSITLGIVSAKERRSSSGVTGTAYQEYLQHDAAVNPGNSGGPLADINGRVIGINTAILGPSYRGVSFAIPASLAKKQYERLRKDGWIERGYLGVSPTPVPEVVRRRLQLNNGDGVFIARVIPDGPAGNSGIRPEDVILEWNGYRATDPTLLSREIAGTEVGSTADVLVKRYVNGRPVEMNLAVRVGVSPFSRRPQGKP